MSKSGREKVAKWLVQQAHFLRSHSKQLSARFRARYIYASAIALILVSGCMTSPTTGKQVPDIQRIAETVREGTEFGVSEALIERPDWAPKFIMASDELKLLASKGSIKPEDLLAILNRLPVKQLQSREARIAITSTRILIAGSNWSVVDAERLEQIRPIILAFAGGIDAATSSP